MRGALVAVDRDDRAMTARLRASRQHGLVRTNAMVVAQVWRDRHGRQVNLARLLRAVDVRAVSQRDSRDAGALLGAAGTPIRSTQPSCPSPPPATAS